MLLQRMAMARPAQEVARVYQQPPLQQRQEDGMEADYHDQMILVHEAVQGGY